jgi:hypothetical protein
MMTRNPRTPLLALILGLSILSLGSCARDTAAYSWLTCDDGDDWILWEEESSCDGCAEMRISTTSFPAGGTEDKQLQMALDSWTDVERSSFAFYAGRDTDGTHDFGNGINEVYKDDIDGPGGTLAVTRLRFNGGWGECVWWDDSNISEADVEFERRETEAWSLSAYSYDINSPPHLRLVAVHEFGHALGLLHEDRWLARMNSIYPAGGAITSYNLVRPLADDRAGVRALYPGSGTARADLAASNYKRTGVGTSGLVSGPTSASRGSTVTIDFTAMNIGSADARNFDIGFYLSSNDVITTSDRLLGTNYNASAPSGSVGTFSRTLTIPNDVPPGNYYLGVVLDVNREVTELSEGAKYNGLAQPRKVRIS